MLRILFGASALALFATVALACDGQTGKVIFEDKFTDDSGGWNFDEDGLVLKAPGATLKVAPNDQGYSMVYLNPGFTATQGDFCTEGPFPVDAAKITAGIGVLFWGKDYANYWSATAYASGEVYLTKIADSRSIQVFKATTNNFVKTGPTDVNSVRAVVKNGTITVFVNGQKVRTVRAQIPSGDLSFGFKRAYLNSSATPVLFAVGPYKVTAGE